jgi:ribonuclease PH
VVTTTGFGERTIHVDCDVWQADGGTRTASITAASLALLHAEKRLMKHGIINQPLLKEPVVGLAVGYVNGVLVIDPDYQEDSSGMADFNFVITKSGNLVEIQGGAEKEPMSWDVFHEACILARAEVKKLCSLFEIDISDSDSIPKVNLCSPKDTKKKTVQKKAPLFSLMNRMAFTQSHE